MSTVILILDNPSNVFQFDHETFGNPRPIEVSLLWPRGEARLNLLQPKLLQQEKELEVSKTLSHTWAGVIKFRAIFRIFQRGVIVLLNKTQFFW